MKKHNIEETIRYIFRDNFKSYPENYPDSIVESIDAAKIVSKGYWDVRIEDEIQRDEQAGVTAQDYDNWVVSELTELKKQSV